MSRRYGEPEPNPIAAVRERLGDRRIRARWERADFVLAVASGLALLLLMGVVVHLWLQSYGFGSNGLAVRHLMASRSCAAAQAGFGQPILGQPGYWPEHDTNGNGVACVAGEG